MTLEPGRESQADRQEKFKELIDRFERTGDPIRQHMAMLMISFLAGLFVGAGKFEEIKDNLDLERWFRLPKSHERRIHGHRHAGVRIVQDGPTWGGGGRGEEEREERKERRRNDGFWELKDEREGLAHVWGEIAFRWPGAEWISSVFRGLLSKQPQIS